MEKKRKQAAKERADRKQVEKERVDRKQMEKERAERKQVGKERPFFSIAEPPTQTRGRHSKRHHGAEKTTTARLLLITIGYALETRDRARHRRLQELFLGQEIANTTERDLHLLLARHAAAANCKH